MLESQMFPSWYKAQVERRWQVRLGLKQLLHGAKVMHILQMVPQAFRVLLLGTLDQHRLSAEAPTINGPSRNTTIFRFPLSRVPVAVELLETALPMILMLFKWSSTMLPLQAQCFSGTRGPT